MVVWAIFMLATDDRHMLTSQYSGGGGGSGCVDVSIWGWCLKTGGVVEKRAVVVEKRAVWLKKRAM